MNHPTWMVGQGISNKTVGIIGLGQNGFAIAKRILGFEIGRILYNDLTELKEKGNQFQTLESTNIFYVIFAITNILLDFLKVSLELH